MYLDALRAVSPVTDDGAVNVFVETPAGSDHKIDLNHETGLLEWSLELPEGMRFPFAFGFVPNTLAEDGDALDILLMLRGTIPAGSMVRARLIGVLRAEQDEADDGEVDTRNDRVIAVPVLAQSYSNVQEVSDLRDNQYRELAAFFRRYNEMIDRAFEAGEPGDSAFVREQLDAAIERAKG